MAANFKIKALQHEEFTELFELDNQSLEKLGAVKMRVDKKPGFPCRVSLEDAELGEEVILLTYQHHQTNSPYQSSGPIFVRRNATTALLDVNEIPTMLNHRLLSIRAYNKDGIMKEASVVEGTNLRHALLTAFSDPQIDYIHIHNAKPGCYNCVAERV